MVKGTVVIGGITGHEVEQALELTVAMYENGEETLIAEDSADTNVLVKVERLLK